MNMTIPVTDQEFAMRAAPAAKRSLAELLAPLERIAADSANLIANHGALLTEYRKFIAYAPNL